MIAYGYDGASTNRIARAAQVSPGSLYQYFSDKDAIVKAVTDRLASDISATIAMSLRSIGRRSPAENTPAILSSVVKALDSHADLLRVAVEQVPRFGDTDQVSALLSRARVGVRYQLVANKHRLRHSDPDTVTWFVVALTTQLCIRYIVERPPIPPKQFVDELAQVLLNYAYPEGAPT